MTDYNDPHKRFYIALWNDTPLLPSLFILTAGFCCVQCSDKVQIDVDFNSWEAQLIQASDRDFPGDTASNFSPEPLSFRKFSPKRVNDYERGYLLGKHISCNFMAYLSFNMPPAIHLSHKETLSNQWRWLVFNLSMFQINFNTSLV